MNIKERDIENLLEQKLLVQKYRYNLDSYNRNVYMQSPRTDEERIKLKGLSPDYCIYLDKDEVKPNIIIEVKKPNMNLRDTLAQGLKYAMALNSEIVIIFDGHILKSFLARTQETLKYNGNEIEDVLSEEEYRKFIREDVANIVTETNIEIQSKQDLIKVFEFANQKLRNAGVLKGIERFNEFSNLLFLKLVSEDNEIINESIPGHIKWHSYKNKTGDELFSYINEYVIPHLETIFNREHQNSLFAKLLIKDTKALKQIIEKLDQLKLSTIKTDIKGDAFEYFIQKYNSTNNDLGEYFTPRHIVNFLVKIASPKYGEKIYDPFCGTGGILISAFNYILNILKEKNLLTQAVKKDLKENTLYGSEISTTAKIAKMNMILTGDGHTNITQSNTLENKVVEKYDVVITNIPFNLGDSPHNLYYTVGTRDGKSQCIEHIIQSLNIKPTARACVIVPEGFLNNDEAENTRKFLIKHKLLKGIISLPVGVFLPYADAKTSILVLQGFNAPTIEDIFYFRVKDDGFTLTTRRRKKDSVNDLDEYHAINGEHNQKISYNDIKKSDNHSLLYFKYDKSTTAGYIKLKEVIRKTNIRNKEQYPTQTITKSDFYGVALGETYWGENFVSVTSKNNENYKVIKKNHFAYNPSRVNIGSIGINISENNLAVSSAYETFEVFNKNFLPEYVYLYLKSREGIEEIVIRSFGSVRQALRMDDLLEIQIPVKSIAEQKLLSEEAKGKYVTYIKAKNTIDRFDLGSLLYKDRILP